MSQILNNEQLLNNCRTNIEPELGFMQNFKKFKSEDSSAADTASATADVSSATLNNNVSVKEETAGNVKVSESPPPLPPPPDESHTLTKPRYTPESYLLPKFDLESLRVSRKEFLQDRPCHLLPLNTAICCECNNYNVTKSLRNDSDGSSQQQQQQQPLCRFYDFRLLRFLKTGMLISRGFLDPFTAPTEDDKKLWMPSNRSSFELSEQMCNYILQNIGYQFCKVIAQEMYAFQYFSDQGQKVLWKRAIRGLRELCDLCATTIFNFHWICSKCAFCLCLDCFKFSSPEFVMVYETKCPSNSAKHTSKKLVLVQMIAGDIMVDLHERYHYFMKKHELKTTIDQECPLVEQMKRMLLFSDIDIAPQVISGEFQTKPKLTYNEHNKQILRLNYNDHKLPAKFALFQEAWKSGDPVIVSDVNRYMDMNLWRPKSFSDDFGEHKCMLIDCSDGRVFTEHLLRVFWDGFDDTSKRLVHGDGNRLLLKLKDWPPGDDFAEVMPRRYRDLMAAIPFPAYANRTGALNIASYLPDYFVKPDLGPKMYTAYGSALEPNKGTTNLHLDVSDAVNIMIYVSVSNEEPQFDMGPNEKVVGAIWHIYHASDADKIREFLKRVHGERGLAIEPNMDPIHDQCWYLDKNLRQRLSYECGVEGFVIMQRLGDAVFIPAGSPHQVKNLQSCIKVAEDFVSPENVTHCCYLTQEFRSLSESHTNHEDKLQIKNIIYHTVKELVSIHNSIELANIDVNSK